MADELGYLLNRVSLDTVDDEVAVHEGDESNTDQGSSDCCLIGKMVMKKPANMDVMRSILEKVWQPSEDVDVQEIGKHTWMFQFGSRRDKLKVLYRQSWSFNKALIVF